MTPYFTVEMDLVLDYGLPSPMPYEAVRLLFEEFGQRFLEQGGDRLTTFVDRDPLSSMFNNWPSDHFEWATQGARLAFRFVPPRHHDELRRQMHHGFVAFARDHREFFERVNHDAA